MGDFTKPLGAVEKGRTYYVITHFGSYCHSPRSSGGFSYVARVSEASQFATLGDAIGRIAKAHESLNWNIVRVTEAPGTKRIVRLVSTTNIDATKPVVVFNSGSGGYCRRGINGYFALPVVSLQEAEVFSDVNDALTAHVQSGAAAALTFGVAKQRHHHIHQVEIVTSEPTITETVLV